MNPFQQKIPMPAGACGERGFKDAAAAKTDATTHGVATFAILQSGQEFAWVSPIEAVTSRILAIVAAGVKLVELCRKS